MSRYAVLVAGAIAALVCGRLGVWQLDRLGARRAANAHIAARLAQPPLGAEALLLTGSAAEDLDYRHVRVAGRFDFEREVIVVGRTLRGVPGAHLVTPLLLASGSALLVERGWAAAPDGRSPNLVAAREPADADVAGVLFVPRGSGTNASDGWPIRVRAADPGLLGPRYPYPLLPLILRRDSVDGGPLRAVPLPELTNGPHLSYAVQWFAFGVIALVGSVVLVRKARVEAGEGGGGR